MNIQTTDKFIRLTPDEGKILVKDNVQSSSVYLPLNADVSLWTEISTTSDGSEIIQLSRDKVVEWCKNNGVFDTVMLALSTDSTASTWFYGECSFLAGSDAALYIQNKLGISDEQIQDLVDYSRTV